MTIGAFSTQGYVRKGTLLSYVDQPARAITLPSSAGTYYLALTTDTHSTVGSFTRVPGSHYAYLQSGTVPTPPDGAVLIASAVVSGGNITAVTPVLSPPLSRQNANAVAITGGSATDLGSLSVGLPPHGGGFQGTVQNLWVDQNLAVALGGATLAANLHCGGTMRVGAQATLATVTATLLGVGGGPLGGGLLSVVYDKATTQGAIWRPTGADAGGASALLFQNVGGTTVGSIITTATATVYNTSSDHRLKRNVQPLTNTLASLTAVRPVSFVWNADDSAAEGFLAHELMIPFPLAVSGLPDEVHPDGSIKPQQVDHSKLVPRMVAWMQELLQRVEAIESALGL